MPITPGSIVELKKNTVSVKEGVEKTLRRGTKGRVCKVMGVYCCVQLSGAGCRRIAKRHLKRASGSAPACTSRCTKRC